MTMASLPHPRTRNTHVFARATDGWYQEPLWCSERLFDVEQFDGPILDIACGAGNVLHSAIGAGYEAIGIDIRSRSARPSKARFLQRDSLRGRLPVHGAIVCNPPYDRFREFVEMAVEAAPKAAIFALHRRLPAARWLQALPLATVHLLSPRPSVPPGAWIAAGNRPGGGTQDFCWLVFVHGCAGSPQVKWLHRDGDVR